jgi:hypothetical protein
MSKSVRAYSLSQELQVQLQQFVAKVARDKVLQARLSLVKQQSSHSEKPPLAPPPQVDERGLTPQDYASIRGIINAPEALKGDALIHRAYTTLGYRSVVDKCYKSALRKNQKAASDYQKALDKRYASPERATANVSASSVVEALLTQALENFSDATAASVARSTRRRVKQAA